MKLPKFLSALFLIICMCSTFSIESTEPVSAAYAASWIAAVVTDSLSAMSEQIRHTIYGSAPISEYCEETIRSIISTLHLEQPADIKQAYQPWTLFAGQLFSNQNTLFISKKMYTDLTQLINSKDQSDIFKNLNEQDKKELITALLMITNQYDNKVLALSVITPLTIWILARLTHSIMKKIKFLTPFNPVTKISYKLSKKFHNSFIAKAFTSALLVGAYIVYQRHLFSLQAQTLL